MSICSTCSAELVRKKGEAFDRFAKRQTCSRKCYREQFSVRLRFPKLVDVRGENDCWPWLGHISPGTGYGGITCDGKYRQATHIALEIDGRPRPDIDMDALHSCDNPPCCNPGHLRWGTPLDNAADRVARDRSNFPIGERHGQAKLTENAVRYIRSCGKTLRELSEEFGMSIGPLSMARSGKTWSHVR